MIGGIDAGTILTRWLMVLASDVIQFVQDAAGVLVTIAIFSVFCALVVYVLLYLWPQFLSGTSVHLLRPIRDIEPIFGKRMLFVPWVALREAVRRIWDSISSMYVEVVRTKNPSDFRSVPSGARFRAQGETEPREQVTSPITGRDCLISFWSIDGWTGARWKQCASELWAGRFELCDADDYGESVVVNPSADTEYDLSGGEQSIVVVEKNEPVPKNLRKFLQEHAPFAPDTLRFREVIIPEGMELSVFGVMTEKNIRGRWERMAEEPEADEVRLVVSTADASSLENEVWRDISANLLWGFVLLGYGCLIVAGYLHLLLLLL